MLEHVPHELAYLAGPLRAPVAPTRPKLRSAEASPLRVIFADVETSEGMQDGKVDTPVVLVGIVASEAVLCGMHRLCTIHL